MWKCVESLVVLAVLAVGSVDVVRAGQPISAGAADSADWSGPTASAPAEAAPKALAEPSPAADPSLWIDLAEDESVEEESAPAHAHLPASGVFLGIWCRAAPGTTISAAGTALPAIENIVLII